MAYCSQADVEYVAGGAERLRQMSDYDRDGVADADAISTAIARASSWIDAHARKQSLVPFDPVPEFVRWLCAEEAVYLLKRTRTDDDREDHLERERLVQGLASGKVTPGTDPAPTGSTHLRGRYTDRPSDKKVSRDKLKGFA